MHSRSHAASVASDRAPSLTSTAASVGGAVIVFDPQPTICATNIIAIELRASVFMGDSCARAPQDACRAEGPTGESSSRVTPRSSALSISRRRADDGALKISVPSVCSMHFLSRVGLVGLSVIAACDAAPATPSDAASAVDSVADAPPLDAVTETTDAVTVDAKGGDAAEERPRLDGCTPAPPGSLCGDDSVCDDCDPRTVDGCSNGRCEHAKACATDAECDDHDPTTVDTCLLHQACRHVGCATDADCDDRSPLTDDRCATDEVTASRRCERALRAGLCRSNAECADASDCTTERCEASACRYAWPASCGVEATPIERCPPGAGVGTVCNSDATPVALPSPCILDATAPCIVQLRCVTASPGTSRYRAVTPALAACRTSCPATPPRLNDPCDATVTPWCDYAPSATAYDIAVDAPSAVRGPLFGLHPPEAPMCTCTPTGWACEAEFCPATPPANGSALALPAWFARPIGALCDYRGIECAPLAVAGAWQWRCHPRAACPRSAPATGAACVGGVDQTCSYRRDSSADPVDTYSGECTCTGDGSAAAWRCGPSLSAGCAATPPADRDPCTNATDHDQECRYFRTSAGAELNRVCACRPNQVTSRWQCYGSF
jgi:hypothetical protein